MSSPRSLDALRERTVARENARRLLDELVSAFGVAPPSRKRALPPLEASEARQYGRRHRTELVAALPALVRATTAVRKLRRAAPLHRPRAYSAAWREIIDGWNDAVNGNEWQTLPPLCEVCGRAVFQRGPEEPGSTLLSLVCSKACRVQRKAARSREQRALR